MSSPFHPLGGSLFLFFLIHLTLTSLSHPSAPLEIPTGSRPGTPASSHPPCLVPDSDGLSHNADDLCGRLHPRIFFSFLPFLPPPMSTEKLSFTTLITRVTNQRDRGTDLCDPAGPRFWGTLATVICATPDLLCDLRASRLPSLCLSPLWWDHNIYCQAVLRA